MLRVIDQDEVVGVEAEGGDARGIESGLLAMVGGSFRLGAPSGQRIVGNGSSAPGFAFTSAAVRWSCSGVLSKI
jgi:hypothetical protein